MDVLLDAFQISGGVILFLFGLTLIFGDDKPEVEKKKITDFKHVMLQYSY
jgi:multiple antibiotic resistance protein